MSGWNSLNSVGTLHALLQISGLLVAAVVIAAGATAYHFRSRWDDLVAIVDRARGRYLPRRPSSDTAMVLHNACAGTAILGIAALLAIGYAASQYGHRKTELAAALQAQRLERVRAETDHLRRALSDSNRRSATNLMALRESEVRHLAETATLRRELEQFMLRRAGQRNADPETEARLAAEIETLRRAGEQAEARHALEVAEWRKALDLDASRRVAVTESLRWEVKQAEARAASEISQLQEQLSRAERKLASLQAKRRLSDDEKNVLINALRPYAGQKVMIAAIAGDEDGKGYAEDFVEVFDAAGWQRTAVSYRHWDRDPVGVEVTLNETDGRAGRINTGVGALINIVRKLSLVDGNTIYLTTEVPAGEVQVKIGKKLPR